MTKSGKPLVEVILDTAGQKGTGRWSAMEAQDLGVPATVIEAAVSARALSAQREQRLAAAKIFGTPSMKVGDALGDQQAALKTLEQALLAGKIAAYAQGFAVMARGVGGVGLAVCRSAPSPRSGAPAASSARSSSTISPRPIRLPARSPT